jgi:hypothetical protein
LTNITKGEFSVETRRRIGVELSKLDAVVQGFSLILDATIKVHDREPVRILQMTHAGLDKAIQISAFFRSPTLGDVPGNVAFGFWTLASADRNDKRRLWSKKVTELDAIPDTYGEQLNLLQICWKLLEPISYRDLKPIGEELQ